MGRDLGTLEEYMARNKPYEAYAGPETGGFNVLPQSAVPDVGMDDETRRRLLGDAQTPLPHAYLGLSKFPDAPEAPKRGDLGTIDEYMAAQSAAAPPGSPLAAAPVAAPQDATLAPETIAPKGGVPRQARPAEAQSWALYHQMKAALDDKQPPQMSWERNLLAKGAHRVAEAGMAVPSLIADALLAPYYSTKDLIAGEGPKPILGRTPAATPEMGAAAIEALRGGDYNTELERRRKDEATRDVEMPISSTIGNLGGDVFTVLGGRVPLARKVLERTSAKAAERAAAETAATKMKPGYWRAQAEQLNSKFAQWSRSTGAKIGETSIEGAGLSILHDGDPVEQAAYAGAGQGAGSILLALAHHPGKTTAAGLLGSVIMWQQIQNFTPVEGHSLDWTAQHVLDKLGWAGAAGIAAGLAGAGRLRGAPIGGRRAEDFPKLAEGLNAFLRTNANSLWEQFTSDRTSNKPVLAPVMTKLSTDASAFKPDELRRLERAARKGGDLIGAVTEMSRSADFRKRMGMQ